MLIGQLQKQLSTPIKSLHSKRARFWLSLSLTFGFFYGYLGGLRPAFESNYIIQDDARQHVFWMLRFLDPDLFPNDLIADYFQSVAPLGYSYLYKFATFFGLNPIFFSKIIPILLGLISTYYCYRLLLELFPIPTAGFIATLLLNSSLWMRDDIASATPRAFMTPLFLAFMYYFVKRSLLPTLIVIALLGLFYPPYALVAGGVIALQLIRWKNGKITLTLSNKEYKFSAASLGLVFLILLPFAFSLSEFDPVISVEQAKALPEFYAGGRSAFFWENPWIYWLGGRGGLIPYTIFITPLLLLGLFLPLLLPFSQRFPLVQTVQLKTRILLDVMLVGLGLFFAAHLLLFKLHLPSRYTQYSLPIILSLAAAIAITIALDSLLRWAQKPKQKWAGLRKGIALTTVTIFGLMIVAVYPTILKDSPQAFYIKGRHPELYQFFAKHPKDILIASLTGETDNLQSFAQRSVFVSKEAAIPYHWGYYEKLRQRILDLIEAQYSPNLETVQIFIQKYGINFWMIEQSSFMPAYLEAPTPDSLFEYFNTNHQSWLQQYQPATQQAEQTLKQGITPALAKTQDTCTVLKTDGFTVLDANCITNLTNL
ncbi:MAG: hypothetical protein ACOC04_00705 [Halothece sp.]